MKLFLSFCLVLLVLETSAQNTFPTSGNAGIGITSALTHPLTIKPSTDGLGFCYYRLLPTQILVYICSLPTILILTGYTK